MQETWNPRKSVVSKLAKLASVRIEIALTVRKEAGRWENLNASGCEFFRRLGGSRLFGSGYLGREAGLDVPVHIATENADLSADLKRALAHARAGNQPKKRNTKR